MLGTIKTLGKTWGMLGAVALGLAVASPVSAQDAGSVYIVTGKPAPAPRGAFVERPVRARSGLTQTVYVYETLAKAERSRQGYTVNYRVRTETDYASLGDLLSLPQERVSPTTYCVRSCDGFYFPAASDAADPASQVAACAAACPGAATEIYTAPSGGAGIEQAVSRTGVIYALHGKAFAFRNGLDNACTCKGNGAGRNYSVMNDLTLRPGDLVMTEEGLKEFRGQSFPHRDKDFRDAAKARLTKSERHFVEAVEAMTPPRAGVDQEARVKSADDVIVVAGGKIVTR